MTDPRGDDGAQRGEELDVAVLEGGDRALYHQRAERTRLGADRNGEEDGVALLSEHLERLVRRVVGRIVAGHGALVLDGLAGHALADVEAHLTHRGGREPDVAAHDELVAVALDEIERADLGLEDLRDSPRRLVEQGHERHRLRRECDEIEHGIEALVASAMDLRP